MEPAENAGVLSFYRRKRFQCLVAILGATIFLVGIVIHLLNTNPATSIFLLCFGLVLICIACVICLFRKEGSDIRQNVFPEVSAMAYGSVYSHPSASSRRIIPTICGSALSDHESTSNLYNPTGSPVLPPPPYEKAIRMPSPPPLRCEQDEEFQYPPPYWKLNSTPQPVPNLAINSAPEYTVQEPLKTQNHPKTII